MCVKSMYIKLLVGTSHLLFFRETYCFFFVVVVVVFLRMGGRITFIFKLLGKLID